MLRKNLLKACVLGLATTVILIWIVSSSENFQQFIHKHKNDQTYDALYKSPSSIFRAYVRLRLNVGAVGDGINDSGAGITAVATIALVFSTVLLWGATKRSVDIAERSLVELEGPYLYPIIVGSTVPRDLSRLAVYSAPESGTIAFPQIDFSIKNFGRSLALFQSIGFELEHFTNLPELLRTDFLLLASPHPIIDAGKETPEPPFNARMKTPLDSEGGKSITAKTSILFLYGEIRFADIFGGNYIQTFCLAWHQDAQTFAARGGAKYNKRTRYTEDNGPH